ncbi:unnamed protein product [Bursaphelenchus xylophilus]|uniref:(pine wood nematode) hypothetical protein n=1 Tax=Bursaphelenchus xylophilus TaxID=6326 RepID=A0A1I7RZI4_BURXY|nr:unnamed protein product [Bursaphelenchus xylophilus]CAG9111257.1 unnamed protein product [Bursaphelenchus xylophilus]
MATTEINGNSVDPEEKPLFEVYTFNGKTLGQLKKDIPGYGRVYYKVKKVHELNEEKGELLCTCFAIRDKVWLPIQTALRLEQRNPLVSGPVAKFFEDQIEANLNVELVFSDDEENPSEEAEEPGSSLENDVNKVEIPSEITEQLEAIRKIPVSPQKELEEEVLALNQCSSTDNGHTDQLEVVEEDAPGFSGGRHANRAPIPAENSATAPEINASPSENHNLEEIVGSQSQESAENEVEFEFLESKQSPSDSVDRALGIAEKESEVNEKGDNNKEKTMETPSTSDSSSNSPSTSSKSDNEEDPKPDNVPCTSKSEEINETRMEIELKQGEEESFLKPNESPRRTRRGRTVSNASSRSSPEKKIGEQEVLEGKGVPEEMSEDVSPKLDENAEEASPQSSQNRRSTRRGRTASLASSKSDQEKTLEAQNEGSFAQMEVESQGSIANENEGEDMEGRNNVEKSMLASENSSQKSNKSPTRRSTRSGRTASLTSSKSGQEKSLEGQKEGAEGQEEAQEHKEEKQVEENALEDHTEKIEEKIEDVGQSSQKLDENLRKRGGRRSRTSTNASSSPEKMLIDEQSLESEAQKSLEDKIDDIPKNIEEADQSSQQLDESLGKRGGRRGRTSIRGSSSPEKKIVEEQEGLEEKEVPEEMTEDTSAKVDENEEEASQNLGQSRRSARRGRTASNTSFRSSPEKKIAEQEALDGKEVPEKTTEDVSGKPDEIAEESSPQSSQSRRSTRRGRTASLASSKSGQEQSLEGQKEGVEGQAEAQEKKEEEQVEESGLEDHTERIEEKIEEAHQSSQQLDENLGKRGVRRSRTSIRASSSPEKKPVDQQGLESEALESLEDKIDDNSKNIEEIEQSSQKLNVKPGRKRTASIASAKSDQERTLEVQNEGSFTQMEVESQDSVAIEIKGTDLEGKRSIEKSKLASGNSSQKSDKSPTRRSTRSGRTASLASSKSGQEQSLEGQKESGDAQAEAEEQKEEKQIEENALEDRTERIEEKIEDVSQSSQNLDENLRKRGGRRGRTSTNASSSPEKMLIEEQSIESEAQKSLEDKIDDIPKNSEEADQSSHKLNVKTRRKRTASLASSKSSQQQVGNRDESEASQEKIAREDVELAENSEEMEDTGRDRVLRGRKRVDPKSGSRVKVAKPKKNQKEEESSQEQKDKEEEAVVGQVQDPESLDLDKSEEKNVEIAQEPSEPRKRGRPGRKKKIAHESGYKSSPETKKKDDSKERLQIPSKLDATGTPEPSGSQNSNFMTPPTKRGPGRPRKTPIQSDLHTPGSSAISEHSKEKKVNNELENSLNESLQSEEDGGRRSGRLRSKPERLVISTKIATKSSPTLTTESPAPSGTPGPAETPAPETPTEAQPSPTWSTPSKGRGRPRKYLPGHEPYKIARPYIKKADRERMEKEKESRISRHSRRSKEEQEAIRKFNIRCAKGIFNMGEETEEDN